MKSGPFSRIGMARSFMSRATITSWRVASSNGISVL